MPPCATATGPGREWGIRVEPANLPSTIGPQTIRLHNGEYWVEILCRSLDNYEQIAGLEVGFAWCDETWARAREAFDMVLGRLRDERGGFNRQILITSTLDDPSHWLYSVFVEGYKPELHDVIYARTSQNPHLPADYEEQLRHSYSALLVRRMLEAEWISLAGGRIYHSFRRDQNISEEAEFDPALPICGRTISISAAGIQCPRACARSSVARMVLRSTQFR